MFLGSLVKAEKIEKIQTKIIEFILKVTDMAKELNHIIRCGDSLTLIEDIPDKSIDLLVTSPPYWAKRIYNNETEIGTEPSVELYINNLVYFFKSMERKLKDSCNIFINLGDTYFGSGSGAWGKYKDSNGNLIKENITCFEKYVTDKPLQPKIKPDGKLYQKKQLLLIPSRFAIAMQDSGWILRDDIIWHKPNRIPTGVTDRFNNTYEHVFHFVLKNKYFFDLDAVKILGNNGRMKNPGDVWSINTQPLKGNHTATFPEKLIENIVLCGSPVGGNVLDPFLGSGTTLVVCDKLARRCIGFEMNEDFYNQSLERYNRIKQEKVQ